MQSMCGRVDTSTDQNDDGSHARRLQLLKVFVEVSKVDPVCREVLSLVHVVDVGELHVLNTHTKYGGFECPNGAVLRSRKRQVTAGPIKKMGENLHEKEVLVGRNVK